MAGWVRVCGRARQPPARARVGGLFPSVRRRDISEFRLAGHEVRSALRRQVRWRACRSGRNSKCAGLNGGVLAHGRIVRTMQSLPFDAPGLLAHTGVGDNSRIELTRKPIDNEGTRACPASENRRRNPMRNAQVAIAYHEYKTLSPQAV